MAVQTKSRPRTRTLATVKNNTTCIYQGKEVLKVRQKTLMTEKGEVIVVPDHTLVQVPSL